MNYLYFLLSPFVILIFMNFFYNFREIHKIKRYLLKVSESEKEKFVLKGILDENKPFFLTKDHEITKKVIDLKIVIQTGENKQNPLQFKCVLNKKIINLIKKDSQLKKIYF